MKTRLPLPLLGILVGCSPAPQPPSRPPIASAPVATVVEIAPPVLDAGGVDAGVADASRSGYAPEELGGEAEHCPKVAPGAALTCTASSSARTVDVRFVILPERSGFRARLRVPALGLDIPVYRGVAEACAECQAEVYGDTLRFVCREDLATSSGEVHFDANELQVSWGPDRLVDAADCHHEAHPLPCAAKVRLHGATMRNTCVGPGPRAGQSL